MAAFSMRVMSFNLRRRKVTDGDNTWTARRASAVDVIRNYLPDFVGTQEGLQDQVDDIVAGVPPAYGWLGEARMGGATDEYNAIFYRKDKFRVIDEGNFWHSSTPDAAGSRTWGNLVPRMCTWAEFSSRETGERFHVYNTHLDHLVPTARRKAAQLVTRRLPEGKGPVVLLGDFNAVPHGGTYRYLTHAEKGGFTDTLRATEMRPENRWNATFHKFTGRGLYRIDYVFLKGAHRVLSHRVVRDAPNGKLPSDHFPIVADLRIGA